MILDVKDIAKMIDLSCVRTYSDEKDIKQLAENAIKYNIGQVSVMQTFIEEMKKLLSTRPDIKIIGNVSFPSGADSTSIKVLQTKELIQAGCHEIDVVANIGKLRSKRYSEVEEDIKAVVDAASNVPVKVIIEISCLDNIEEIEKVCEICINAGASFVKTGTGWLPKPTTIEDVKLLKNIVGDRIKIKASGGIRDLKTLIKMYNAGASRFGVNLRSGKAILDECIALGGKVDTENF